MKKVYITLIMLVIAVAGVAQQRQIQGRGYMGANPKALEPVLTAEQSEAIVSLRNELKKDLLQINNQLAEKRAQLKTLQQTEKPNLKAIDSKIDEITDLQNKKMKLVARTEAKIRENLTEEQRLQYDLRKGKRGQRFTMSQMNRVPYRMEGAPRMKKLD